MTDRVAKLPTNVTLRQDKNLDDGVYVGPVRYELNFSCKEAEKDDAVLGNCSSQPPKTAYIDDRNGLVYVPTADGAFLRGGAADGIRNFVESPRWDAVDAQSWKDRWLAARLEYRGFKALTIQDLERLDRIIKKDNWSDNLVRGGIPLRGALYAYVLDHRQRADIRGAKDLLKKAAEYWLDIDRGERRESRYASLAHACLVERASDDTLDSFQRFWAGREAYETAKTDGELTAAFKALAGLAADRKVQAVVRLEAADCVVGGRDGGLFMAGVARGLLDLLNDPKADAQSRFDAGDKIISRISDPTLLHAAFGGLVSLAIDGRANAGVRLDTAKAVYHKLKLWNGSEVQATAEQKTAVLDAMLSLARDRKAVADSSPRMAAKWRVLALNWIDSSEATDVEKKKAARSILDELAWNDPDIAVRYEAQAELFSRTGKDAERTWLLRNLLEIANTTGGDSGVRAEAIWFVNDKARGGSHPDLAKEVASARLNLARDPSADPETRFREADSFLSYGGTITADERTAALKAMLSVATKPKAPCPRIQLQAANRVRFSAIDSDLAKQAMLAAFPLVLNETDSSTALDAWNYVSSPSLPADPQLRTRYQELLKRLLDRPPIFARRNRGGDEDDHGENATYGDIAQLGFRLLPDRASQEKALGILAGMKSDDFDAWLHLTDDLKASRDMPKGERAARARLIRDRLPFFKDDSERWLAAKLDKLIEPKEEKAPAAPKNHFREDKRRLVVKFSK